jgi:hypothetical protein
VVCFLEREEFKIILNKVLVSEGFHKKGEFFIKEGKD